MPRIFSFNTYGSFSLFTALFLFTGTVLLCNSSYHMISRRQYNSYWLDILNLFNFEFGGCFYYSARQFNKWKSLPMQQGWDQDDGWASHEPKGTPGMRLFGMLSCRSTKKCIFVKVMSGWGEENYMENQAALRRDNGLFLQCLNCHIVFNAHTENREPETSTWGAFWCTVLHYLINIICKYKKKREEWREKSKYIS